MALSSAIAALVVIVSVPVIVGRLGTVGYGVWECMLAVSSAAMIFQTSISGTLLWRISMTSGAGDADASRRLVRLGVGLTLMITSVFTPVIWFWRESIVEALQVPDAWSAQSQWLLPQVVLLMLLGGMNQSLLALIAGYQRAGLASLIQTLGLVVTHGTAIAGLCMGGDLNALLWGMIAGFFTTLSVSGATAWRICGKVSLVPIWPSRDDLRVLAPFCGLLLLSNVALVMRDNTDKLVLATQGTPAMAAYFSMAQRFASLVMQVGWTVCLPLTAAVGSLYAVNNWTAIRQMYARVNTWLAVASGLAGFLICTLRTPLFVLWLGADQLQAHAYLAVLLFGVCFALTFTGAGVALAKGVGRPGLETAYTLATLVLILGTKPLLVLVYGGIGCVLSSAASWCVGAACFALLLHRRLKLPATALSQAAAIFLVSIIASAGGWFVTSRYPMAIATRSEAAFVLLVAGVPLAAAYLGILCTCRLIPPPLHVLAALRLPGSVAEANT